MKSIMVTGAGSGLGKELAILFAKQGYHLLLTGRTQEKLEKTKQTIETTGGHADILLLDIRNKNEINEKIKEITQKHALIGLVNNAGVGHFGSFIKMDEHLIQESIETNVLGTIYLTQAVLPYLLEYGDGRIMNIISTAGLRGKVNESVYCASKFAVRGFTESLQKEYEHTNLTINAVYMGGMDTPFWEGSTHVKDPSRFWSPQEIAAQILEQLDESTIIIESKKS